MPFTLEPNPGLYTKLAAQWEAEEQQRLHKEAHSEHWICAEWYHFIFFLVALLAIFQVVLVLYRQCIAKRRHARQQRYRHDGNDVENVGINWREDMKASYTDEEVRR